METTEIFERLKTLQNILVQKYDLEAKIEEAPKQLSSQEELLSRLKKEFIVKNADYETIKEKVLKLRAELEEAIKEVKKEMLSDSNMMKLRFSVVTRHIRKEGSYCVIGFANSINDTTLSGVAEASNFLVKKDIPIAQGFVGLLDCSMSLSFI